MKFIINGDKLKIEQAETINSGSFEDYLMPVEFDESWDNLNIEAIIAQDKSEQGVSRAVVNNQVYIDMSKKKRYTIGFIGYTVENNQKVHQKTTDLKIIPMLKGAGEIEATNTEEVPTESEWEVYLAQVQEFINNGNEIINQANNLDLDITTDGETSTIIITRKDGTEKRAVVSGAVEGDLDHSKFQNLDYEHAGHIGFQATINDLNTIREGANAGATAVQPKDLGSLATKNIIDYDTDIANKPIIPEEVTESTISSWGFTKNTGTYSKPNGGIPKTDLTSSVQASLEKADSALQSHQDISIKEDKINKSDNFKTSSSITYASTKALVDGLETKQNKLTAGNNITIENDVISATGGSSGGTSNYNDLSNKPKINNVELSGNKSLSDLGIATKTSELTNDSEFVSDSNYTHTDNNYTTTEKDKLASLSKIDSQNKLNSDLVDDTSTTNKFTSTSEKNSWNAKYDKPSGGIPSTDMSSGVQASLRKADTAIQDVSDKEDKSNKVTTLSSDSTDTQYPSAKCVHDSQATQDDEIEALQTENARLKATLPTTTGEGQDVTLDKTAEMEFIKPPLPRGNSEQEGEPSPDNEVPITNVTGNVGVTISNGNNTESKTLSISLGNIELCKIGDYQDYLYKNNGKWYKYNAIDKLVLNGSESWTAHDSIASGFYLNGIANGFIDNTISDYALSNYFTQKAYKNVTSLNNGEFAYGQVAGSNRKRLVLKDTDYTTVADFKTWLSNNNVLFYYVLATPTNIEITDATLISQLEEISKTLSYQGQTNITSNTIALFSVEAYQSTKLILQNIDSRLTLVEG